jgi:hypothetical protein
MIKTGTQNPKELHHWGENVFSINTSFLKQSFFPSAQQSVNYFEHILQADGLILSSFRHKFQEKNVRKEPINIQKIIFQ